MQSPHERSNSGMKEHRTSSKHVTTGDDHQEEKLMHSPATVTHKKQKKNTNLGLGGHFSREHMTDRDWEAKFDLLMSEDLIDLPQHLAEEKLYFTDPDQMDEIFGELEERNLYLIHRKQEMEDAMETLSHDHRKLQKDLGRNRDLHLANKIEVQEKIALSLANVNEFKKQGQMQLVSHQATAAGSTGHGNSKDKGKKAVDDSDINLEEILNDIQKVIFNIYKNNINPHADINAARNPLDLLTQIESVMEHAMREISHIEDVDLEVVNKEERVRKGNYKKLQLQQKQIVEERENMAKNLELKARMDRVVEKVGKTMMPRSTKKKIKKEVVVVKIDEDRLDFMRYLGDDMADMADEIKEKNGG